VIEMASRWKYHGWCLLVAVSIIAVCVKCDKIGVLFQPTAMPASPAPKAMPASPAPTAMPTHSMDPTPLFHSTVHGDPANGIAPYHQERLDKQNFTGMVYPLKFYGGGEQARTKCDNAQPENTSYFRCNNNMALFNDLSFVSNASGREIAPEWVQCTSESSVCQSACYDFCDLSVYRQYGYHRMLIARQKEPNACEINGKKEFMYGCVRQCMRDKCNRNCARCKTDWGNGALKCTTAVVDACPDDMAAGMKFYIRYKADGDTKERCACDGKTTCLDGRSFNDPGLSSDIFPAGKDGKPAQMSTRGEMWHPRDTPRKVLLAGLKRLVCHDGKCDTYKAVQCMVCDQTIAASRKGRALKSDSSDSEKWLKVAATCVESSIDQEGLVLAAKNCSKANIKAADADFTDENADGALQAIAMEGMNF